MKRLSVFAAVFFASQLIGDVPSPEAVAQPVTPRVGALSGNDPIVSPKSETYSLIRVTSPFTDAKFSDIEVLTVANGVAVYVPVVETAEPGVYVFTGPPGTYTIRVAAFYEDRVAKRYANTVIGMPTPIPGPGPGPGPGPVPINPDVPDGDYGLTKMSYGWARALSTKDKAAELSGNFSAVASQLAAGGFITPGAANDDLKARNVATLGEGSAAHKEWTESFFVPLGAELSKLKLANPQDVAKAFTAVSAGLALVK